MFLPFSLTDQPSIRPRPGPSRAVLPTVSTSKMAMAAANDDVLWLPSFASFLGPRPGDFQRLIREYINFKRSDHVTQIRHWSP